jgi:hypothetical protein
MPAVNQHAPDTPRPRVRHPWLSALPGGEMPLTIACRGARFEHVQTFKHDFFAATGLYRGPGGLAVLKLGRTTDCLSLPMAWIGKLLTRREIQLYSQCQDLPGVPRLIGPVDATGFLHAYVPGHPLRRRETVSDTFFDELSALVRALHARHIAYVDLNKRQNILLGDDGRPYLIDFQISLFLPPIGWRRLRPVRWLLARFQQADCYHCLKHKRRLRPDLLTPEERARLSRLSIWIRLHRWLTRPLTNLRRRTLKRLEKTAGLSVTGSSAK